MKTILFPTDFSDVSDNALNFAMVVARQQNAKLLVLHTYEVPLVVSELPYDTLAVLEDARRKEAERKMDAFAGRISHAGVRFNTRVEAGIITDRLPRIASELQPLLVIMGTAGNDSFGDTLFGTNASRIVQRLSCPVWVVPRGANFGASIREIVFATDLLHSDLAHLRQLCELAAPMDAKVTVLHVTTDLIAPEKESALFGEFMKAAEEDICYRHLSYELLHGQKVADRLAAFLRERKADLLVLSNERRSALARIFGRSMSAGFVMEGELPVIVFHHRKDTAVKAIT